MRHFGCCARTCEWPSGCRACNYLDEVAPLHFRPQPLDGRIVLTRSSSWKGLEQRLFGADRFEADFRDGSIASFRRCAQHIRFSAANGHYFRDRWGPNSAGIGHPASLVYRCGRQTTKSNRLTTIKPARTHIATQLLVRDRCARRARQRENIEASEFGLRDAQHVARSLIIVGDPFLRGRVPMMGVVEVFPEWPPWFAFTLLS
jgi:hypothetical protein